MAAGVEWLTADLAGKPVWEWLGFLLLVLGLLVLDLAYFGRGPQGEPREIGVRESLRLSALYVAVALAYAGWIYYRHDVDPAIDFLTGYVVEKSLAMDNIFVISLVFAYFNIPRRYQHRTLFWGILGVLLLRGVMIGLGAALVANFEEALLVFGGFLLFSGARIVWKRGEEPDIGNNVLWKFAQRHLRITGTLHGERFFVVSDEGHSQPRLQATPLFMALLMVEGADVVFAVDSVPAVFGITRDPYIVYTSNIFAILGLRALYFALAALIDRFRYLDFALAAVLVFIGGKIFYDHFVGHVPALLSLAVTLGLLGAGMAASLRHARRGGTEAVSRRARNKGDGDARSQG